MADWESGAAGEVDQHALRILKDTFWGPKGWKAQRSTPPGELAYAIAAGYMFPPVTVSHDEAVRQACAAARELTPEHVGAAFVASLPSRRLDWRSALGSYAVSRHLPEHAYAGPHSRCAVCGGSASDQGQWNVYNFERHQWGGIRHLQPGYAAFDLAQFAQLDVPEPDRTGWGMLRMILELAAEAESEAGITHLEKQVASILPSNKSERTVLLQVLGYCGILEGKGHPGFHLRYICKDERPDRNSDWNYPACWWRGADGVNWDAVRTFFPSLT